MRARVWQLIPLPWCAEFDRLEAAIGQRLFNRLNAGVTLTDDGNLLAADVRAMERCSLDIMRRTKIVDERVRGVVRVAISEGLGTYWLMPKLIEFQYANRMLTFELNCTMELTDVSRLQSDISIQLTRPSNPDMIVTRLGRMHVFPFVAESYQRLFGPARHRCTIFVTIACCSKFHRNLRNLSLPRD